MKTTKFGMGWQRDLPDIRDYTPENEKIDILLNRIKYKNGGIRKSIYVSKKLKMEYEKKIMRF